MNTTQTYDQELSLRNQQCGHFVQPRYVSLPLTGGGSSVPAAALSNDGSGSSDSGSVSAGRETGWGFGSVSQSPLHSSAMPPGSGQGISGGGPAAQLMQPLRTLAGLLSQQSVASGLGRPGAHTDARATGSISGNDLDQARVNPQGTGLADRSLPQSSHDPNVNQGQGGAHNTQSFPEMASQGAHVANAPNRRTRRRQEMQEKKLAVRIASLNMNGFGRLMTGHPENKWGNIYRVMKEQHIAVLMLQETHLTPERVLAVEKMTAHNIKIFYLSNPERPTAREGVAVVLNKKLLRVGDASVRTIVPGRVLQVSVPWHGNEVLQILCVYAPTSEGEAVRKAFFETVSGFYRERPRLPRPTIMAGDFNNIEDMVDRMPMGGGPDSSVEAMDDLKLET